MKLQFFLGKSLLFHDVKRTVSFLTCFLLIFAKTYSQKEANIWYFGQNAGLDFSSGTPVAISNGKLHTTEGCASICDNTGNLLFYTDGTTVYNKNHVVMANGTNLGGASSSSQSAVIIQKPGSNSIYYIFTVDYEGGFKGLQYSEVDMALNGNLGGVTATKNILLYTPSCEKITAVRHCNNKDIWIVTHQMNSNAFKTYLVTSAGVNMTPINSNIGSFINMSNAAIGCMKASYDGTKIASAISHTTSRVELFDFDNSTGILSNFIQLPAFTTGTSTEGPYGIEFSPDGTKLYCSIFNKKIYQFNLCAGSNTAIMNSKTLIATSSSSTFEVGSLQLGPDNKIYVARRILKWVGVINNPNALGTACNYIDNGVALTGDCEYGLPNFVPYYFKQAPPAYTESIICLNGTFTAPTVNLSNCSGSAITSLVWNFGDPVSGINNTSTINNPSHTFSSTGTYSVSLILNYKCGSDTITKNINVSGLTITTATTPAQCETSNGSATVTTTGGVPSYTYSWMPSGGNSATASNLASGSYTVIVTDANNCSSSSTIFVPNLSSPTASVSPDITIQLGSSTVLNASGGTNYNWIPPTGLNSTTGNSVIATPSITTQYCVIVTDNNNCKDTACVTVFIESPCISSYENLSAPNAFSPNGDNVNDDFCLLGWNTCVDEFSIVIYNRWGEKVYESREADFCWDGKNNNKSIDPQVLVYYIQAKYIDGKKIIKTGNVSLIH